MQGLLLSAIVSCCVVSAVASDHIEGEIALSAPQCDFFVVQTGPGFSLLHEDDYFSVFEGDPIRGSLHTLGSQEIEIVGEVTLGVTIEDWGLPLYQAKTSFYSRCRQ
ncbi:hypothetical protein BB934_38505 (plasmid) [Microvirga ossetica]|uniref:Uncharacterized protein n=1 Tax=Microvirga ossetica TaxID=1882682 RepID=A0A1B2EW10_9HYPH|nr:hypothetical protein [Microvirga ossetica]ANY84142.1 hypothetical protein BB934_38505 [Microvirga ossetica]